MLREGEVAIANSGEVETFAGKTPYNHKTRDNEARTGVRTEVMLKKVFYLMVLCTSTVLAIHLLPLLPNAPHFSLLQAQAPQQARETIYIDRPAAREIKDPNPSFSAVAVDVVRDEIVLQDESLEQITVYDRLANSRPNATLT